MKISQDQPEVNKTTKHFKISRQKWEFYGSETTSRTGSGSSIKATAGEKTSNIQYKTA